MFPYPRLSIGNIELILCAKCVVHNAWFEEAITFSPVNIFVFKSYDNLYLSICVTALTVNLAIPSTISHYTGAYCWFCRAISHTWSPAYGQWHSTFRADCASQSVYRHYIRLVGLRHELFILFILLSACCVNSLECEVSALYCVTCVWCRCVRKETECQFGSWVS